jgi:AcrR family transcriptional regulator
VPRRSTTQTLHVEPRPELSAQDIVATTIRMWAETGVRQVSLRRLAAEFGVSATAIYYHIPDKDTLIGSAAQVIIEQWASSNIAGSWSDRLRALLVEENRILRRYPGLARYLIEHRDSPAALAWSEALLAALLDAGFSESAAAAGFGRITMLINPLFLLDDFSEAPGHDLMTPWAERLDADPAQFPSLAKVQEHVSNASFDEMFEQNAHALVDSLESELAQQRSRRRKTRTRTP